MPATRLARFVQRCAKGPFAKRQRRRLAQLLGRPRAARRPGVVLMLHVGRCGSTVLADLLDQHPEVYWDGKLPRVAKWLYGDRLAALDFPVWMERQYAIAGGRFYGFEFKVLDDQYPRLVGLSTEAFLDACRARGVTHYVLLARKNTLRHVVSHYASKSRGSWHASTPGETQKKSFVLDIGDVTTGSDPGRQLVDYMREVDAAHDTVRTELKGENLLEIEYEHDINEMGAEHAYAKVCNFLGIASPPVAVRRVRTNPFPLDSVLENYDEVVAALADTEFAWMTKD